MKTMVPPPPIFGATGEDKPKIVASAPRVQSPFDAAFLGRVYRATFVFGAISTGLFAFGLRSFAATGSFAGAILLAALMLRVQETSIRALLQPSPVAGGFNAKQWLLLALPLKFIGIGLILWFVNGQGWLRLGAFALGFGFAQAVLVCQVAGLLLRRALNSKL